MDQILKLPPDAKLRDTAAEEGKFKKNINEYKARATAKATAAANEVGVVSVNVFVVANFNCIA